ncbi:hypothetical protein FAM21834_01471 [Lentilactobacillus parabuchneri]|uniref:Uncharacterized protein n=1 Tax=Lentilactobacillus parabuchneri TaxID=152331 RepID=A0A1X1FEI3_9LACO|nr:hypothetical protein [Lentilactobacillus parabuchneri]ORN09499.1 hypothetical protein FAM21834_01471 [Lentilactobacillus parabuchneri]ORN29084.1 hypothetical protein FAM23169_01361 [Lentilactobacillus parabuchneri]
MNLNVGIDVSKLKLDYCGMDSNKQVCFQGEVINTPKGAGHIRDEILDSFLDEVEEFLVDIINKLNGI